MSKNGQKNVSKSQAAPKNGGAPILVWAIVAVAAVALGWLLFSPGGGSGGGLQNVDAAKMAELAAGGDVTVLDVRTQGEYEAGHIPGAVNMPVDQLQALASSLDPAAPVAVYCATGSRSASAVQYLEQAGFKTIYHFDQGMVAWTGEVENGAVASAPVAVDEDPLESPVLYEFYTDW